MTFKMTTFSFLLLSLQVCLVQNVFGQCLRDIAPPTTIGYGLSNPRPCLGAGLASSGFGAGLASSSLGNLAASEAGLGAGLLGSESAYGISSGAYGGSGVGNLNVFGEIPVGGSTLLSGQVPILGSVHFGAPVSAAGSVIISGTTGCGCNYGY